MALPAILGALGSAAGAGATGATAAGATQAASALTRLATGLNTAAVATKTAEGGITALSRGIGGLASPVSAALGVISSFREAVVSLGNQLAPFVEKANPAFVKQFQFAVDDLSGSIGRVLVPIMEFATAVVRGFADVVYDLGGPLTDMVRSVFQPLADLIPTLTRAFAAMLSPLRPIIELVSQQARLFANLAAAVVRLQSLGLEALFSALGSVMEVLVAPLTLVVRFLGDAAAALNAFVERVSASVRRLLGLREVSGSSVGASARNAQLGGVEGFQSKALTAAFGMGTASTEERTATLVDGIHKWLVDKLPPLLMEVAGKIARDVAAAIPGAETAGRVVSGVGEAGRAAGRYIEARPESVGGLLPMGGSTLLSAGFGLARLATGKL